MIRGLKRDRFVIGILQENSVLAFVTAVEGRNVKWDAGLAAKTFSKSYAEDIVYGLQLNGYHAMVIDPMFLEQLNNPSGHDGIHQD